MKREESMGEAPETHLKYWRARIAAAEAGSLAAFEAQVCLAIAQYSAGDALDAVRKTVSEAVATLALGTSPLPLRLAEHYYPALWALSMSIILGDASPAFALRMAGQDQLIDRLLEFTNRQIVPSAKLLHPKAMQHLVAAMDAPQNATASIDAYLAAWYAAMGPTPWHDTHLRQDPSFFGYWALELAAVAKALNVSDGPFSRNTYYPRDLVHQREYRPWLDDGKQAAQAEAIAEVPDRIQAIQELMLAFFGKGEANAEGEQALDSHLKYLGRLLKTDDGAELPEDPEAMRLGFLQLLKAVSSIAEEAVTSAHDVEGQAGQIATLHEMEQELLLAHPELAELNAELTKEAQDAPESVDSQTLLDTSRARLASVHEAIEAMLQDQSIGLEQLFEGMESLHARLGLTQEPALDIYADVSARVGKSLDEANKKNMITEDFDWSSLWRKD